MALFLGRLTQVSDVGLLCKINFMGKKGPFARVLRGLKF